ncbi:MAG: ABC transporter permease [Candidatus Moranbacteria bacterium]|nr:ABC transporter permease [Candidatus Moranbacteria bacterium]
MNILDFIQEIYTALTVNKVRSGLTVLGIVIGIGSVIIMVGIGRGAQTAIQANIQAIGSNLLMIRPGSQQGPGSAVQGAQGSAQSLTEADVAVLRAEMDAVDKIAPEVSAGRKQVIAQGNNTNTSITGVTAEYATVRNVTVGSGVFFNPDQERSLAKVAFVGPDVATDLFGEESNPVGKKIRIGTIDFTVIGVAVARGGTSFGSSDDFVYIPLSTARQFYAGNQYLSAINIRIKDDADMTGASDQVTTLLREAHDLAPADAADFRVMNQADIVSTASSVTSTFTALLGAVAGISLIVGGIGIMNMMLTTVTERTREIGLRKSIGAKRRDIQLQFLFEAIVLTFFGGVLGVLIGFVVTAILSLFGINSEISSGSVILAFAVSTAIGIIFGYYPAHRAARLSPMEALRYE